MEFWYKVIPKLISSVLSIVDASNLRDRIYQQKEEHELMWTALDDIKRMYPDHKAGYIAKITLEKIPTKYGKE